MALKFSTFLFRPKRPPNQFVPRLYGFKIHPMAYQLQQQAAANFKVPMRAMTYNNGKREFRKELELTNLT